MGPRGRIYPRCRLGIGAKLPSANSPLHCRRGSSLVAPHRKTPISVEPVAASDIGERFFEVSIDMLCFLDFNGYFKRLNPAWERTLGFTRDELMSKPFIEFVHPEDRERTLRQNAEVRRGGQALGFENRYLCKDGSYKWFRWNAASDRPEGVIYSVARDITAEKQAHMERENLVAELQAALAEVKSLQEILPICSYCKRIRDDENYWHTVESYISDHTDSRFSHSICPACMKTHVDPQLK
jgi:PAS domain S-box-containing protein